MAALGTADEGPWRRRDAGAASARGSPCLSRAGRVEGRSLQKDRDWDSGGRGVADYQRPFALLLGRRGSSPGRELQPPRHRPGIAAAARVPRLARVAQAVLRIVAA